MAPSLAPIWILCIYNAEPQYKYVLANALYINIHILARGNKTGDKMTLSVDAARAAFNSSYATDSVKQPRRRF